MAEKIWQRVKQNHLLLMVLCCLLPIILIIGFLVLSEGNSKYLVWLVILLCPILHIWLMRGSKSKKERYQCPECGLEYGKEEWAKKCETWCKEHKSCNLEIIKYAIKK